MSRGPLTALLAVLAVAGYQNREKIGEVLRGLGNRAQPQPGDTATSSDAGGVGDILGRFANGVGLGDILGGNSPGGILSGGLGGLLDHFRDNGQGEKAKSWVETGPNEAIQPEELTQALGPDVVDELIAKTGLSKEELIARLSRDLPKAVDDLTPDGTVPTETQATDLTQSASRSSVPNVGARSQD